MMPTLEQRLRAASTDLSVARKMLGRHASIRVSPEVTYELQVATNRVANIDHWLDLIRARSVATELLFGLEDRADSNDCVPFGSTRAKFRVVRLLGTQAYLSAHWALADELAGMAGAVLCTPDLHKNLKQPANVANFTKNLTKTAAVLEKSMKQTFGWPSAVGYALRNHFLHHGAPGFFEGDVASSAFQVSEAGWKSIELIAKGDAETTNYRPNSSLPENPRADLRELLSFCEREIDDALGVLVGTACRTTLAHVAFVVGEE